MFYVFVLEAVHVLVMEKVHEVVVMLPHTRL
jgi:hypothetical protein